VKDNLRDHPVFICGHPKSGTSLVRSLLDSHPELVVYPEETMFFRRYLPKAQGLSLEQKLDLADKFLIHMFEWNQIDPPVHQAGFLDRDYLDISFEAISLAMRQIVAEEYRQDGDILSAAVLAFGKVSGQIGEHAVRWVEKTPFNEYYVKQILGWWPDALLLHVVRDPRDNFVSYKRKHPEWSARTFAESWSRSTQSGLAWQAKLGPDRYRVLHYEQLIESPEGVLREICEFLGINDHPTLKMPTRNGKDWGGNSMFAEQFKHISASPVGRWKKTLGADDLVLLEGLARAPIRQMGYELSGTKLTDARPGVLWQLAKASLSHLIRGQRRRPVEGYR
jgi:hypothetical protein